MDERRHAPTPRLPEAENRPDDRRHPPRDATQNIHARNSQAVKAKSRKGKTGNAASVQNARPPDNSGNERIPAAQSPSDRAPSTRVRRRRRQPHIATGPPAVGTVSAKGSPGGSVGSSIAGVLGDKDASPSRNTDNRQETKRGGDEGPPPRQDPDIIDASLKTLTDAARQRTMGGRRQTSPADEPGQGAMAEGRPDKAGHDRVLRPHGPVHASVPARQAAVDAGLPGRHRRKVLLEKGQTRACAHVDRIMDVPR